MRYYCPHCEQYFDEEELTTRQECIGEYWGSPAYETFNTCPYCGDDEVVSEEDDDFPPEYLEEELEDEDDE